MSTIASLQSLANDIASGFDALLERLDDQKKVEADLRVQLSRVSDRVCARLPLPNHFLLSGCYQL